MRAIVFVIASAVCFGTTGTSQAYGPDAASSAAVGLTRIVFGGALLGLLAWWVGRRGGQRSVATPGGPRWGAVVIGGAAVVAYQPAFFEGARLNGVAVGAVVTLGAAPVMTGLLEWVVRRTAPSSVWFAATGCAVTGVVLLSGLLEGAGQSVSARGLVGSLAAAFAYAVYTLAAKHLLDGGWRPTAAVGTIFATAAVIGAPFLLLVDLSWLSSRSGIALVAWLAVVTIVVAYVLFAIGLQSLSASTVSTLTLVEPLTACVLGLVMLGEQLSGVGWTGLVVLLVGVALLAWPTRPVAVPA
ncbi:DMT family transporter [Aeromicrobium sp. P5_D10]